MEYIYVCSSTSAFFSCMIKYMHVSLFYQCVYKCLLRLCFLVSIFMYILTFFLYFHGFYICMVSHSCFFIVRLNSCMSLYSTSVSMYAFNLSSFSYPNSCISYLSCIFVYSLYVCSPASVYFLYYLMFSPLISWYSYLRVFLISRSLFIF